MSHFIEYERKNFEKLQRTKLLPNRYKLIGFIVAISAFIGMLISKFIGGNEISRLLISNMMLLSLLLVAVSRDKQEDEMTLKLRGQAFVFAFICGVLYALVQPFISHLVDLIVNVQNDTWYDMSVLQVLLFMLLIQISFYHFSKKIR